MDTLTNFGVAYRPRVVDAVVSSALAGSGAVIIEGPRGCGKTMTALNLAESYVFLDSPEAQELAEVAPQVLLDGAQPRLLDEWQVMPEMWNRVRRQVDLGGHRGSFILTGSAVPSDDVTRHSGAGRFLRVREHTLTWFEKGCSRGSVSLRSLLDGEPVETVAAAPTLDDVIAGVVRSGFPGLVDLSEEGALRQARAYLGEVARTDLPRLASTRQRPVVIDQLLRSFARSTASEVTQAAILKDLEPVAGSMARETLASLIEVLRRMFVVEAVPAWIPRLRSKARVRTSPKYHLADPVLSAAALGATSADLRRDLETLGLMFESAVVHDLMALGEASGAQVHHYRDSNGREIDAVLTWPGGRWAAVEVKLGGRAAGAAAEKLRVTVEDIATHAGPPVFTAVVTGTGATMQLDNGVSTFPLAALGS
ncbi:ATP-binding protein [Brachybacterium sp. Marseille-Q2903]|uniref:ATP-binding protein n=1 Tax=Brachybacterium epidermidis TaxID=2781983 RepID=A0ABR9W2N7_9MICO|nr:ATP-binding protein [Brachybacterium epidermidis]